MICMHLNPSLFFFTFYITFYVSIFVSIFKGIRGSNPDSVSETSTSLIYKTFPTQVHNDMTNIAAESLLSSLTFKVSFNLHKCIILDLRQDVARLSVCTQKCILDVHSVPLAIVQAAMKGQGAQFLRPVGEQDLDVAGKVVDLAEVNEYGDLAAQRKISCVKRSQDNFLN